MSATQPLGSLLSGIKIDCLKIFFLQILSPRSPPLPVMVQQIFFIKTIQAVRIVTVAKNPFYHILHEPGLPFQRVDNFSKLAIICCMPIVTVHQRTGSILHAWKPILKKMLSIVLYIPSKRYLFSLLILLSSMRIIIFSIKEYLLVNF